MTVGNFGVWKSEQTTTRGRAVAPKLFLGALLVGICASILFLEETRIDLTIAHMLYVSPRRFIGSESIVFQTIRSSFTVLFSIVCGLAAVGCVLAISLQRRWLGLSGRDWVYLSACLLIGPLTIANLGFKDHWGRPRPVAVREFGGDKAFSPPLMRSDQCERNCSFVSGEASSIYILCFAAAILFPGAAGVWISAGVLLGSVAGFVRMAEGGHFLSDVIFAGVFMGLTAGAVGMLFEVIASERYH